jgi:hypothetical protein
VNCVVFLIFLIASCNSTNLVKKNYDHRHIIRYRGSYCTCVFTSPSHFSQEVDNGKQLKMRMGSKFEATYSLTGQKVLLNLQRYSIKNSYYKVVFYVGYVHLSMCEAVVR